MGVHRLIREQQIPAPPEEVWRYFSRADNLQAITPEYMNFRVTSGDLPEEIYPGMIITYKVSPVLGIPLFWMTEITHVVPGTLFVDEQRRGPFSMWHHEHHFEARDGGTFMRDIVHYQTPLGPLGEIARMLFVKKQVEGIFSYRLGVIEKIFPSRR
jgi:ligand-binding SRPBCC domain-containing protein